MEWEYWNQQEEDIYFALKLEQRKLQIILERHFPYQGKKLKVIFCHFSPNNKNMGEAYFDEMLIKINKHYIMLHSLDEAIDTLRHEYAHIFSYLDIGYVTISRGEKTIDWQHNKNWKKWCRYLGARPFAKAKILQKNLQISEKGIKLQKN